MSLPTIISPQNPKIKQIKQLASAAKWRKKYGQTIIDGIHLCQSYLQAGHTPILCLSTPDGLQNAEVQTIIEQCSSLGVEQTLISPGLFNALSPVENAVGVMMVISIPKQAATPELTDNTLLLDDIQDPGNVGTMLRTAAAADLNTIYSSPQTVDIWSPKVLRAGMGAHFSLDIFIDVSLQPIIQSSKIQVLATSLSGKQTIYETDLSQPTAWILGNEGRGVSEELLSSKVTQVIIPQNPNVESLNVAAATAVCLFEQRRQMSAFGAHGDRG